jgi:triacylglycerol lipase
MGGLDTRHMIVDIDGMADKVASLTTIGTPHLGTSLADFLLDGGGNNIIEATRRFIHLDGFKDLTVQACTEFNQRAEAKECANNVVYQTYASAQKINDIFAPLQDSSDFIAGVEGENDGLVSAVSQQWKSELIGDGSARKPVAQFTFPIPADHLNEVGWWDPQEDNLISLILRPGNQIIEFEDKIKNVYLEIARGLRNLE